MSSFKDKPLSGDAMSVLGELHGFVDSRAIADDGMTAEEMRELKDALDAWAKDRFGFTPTERLKQSLHS